MPLDLEVPTAEEARLDLLGMMCQCGSRKGAGKSFCYRCYKRLPSSLQKRLYQLIGDGYELAYAEALKVLGRA